MWSKNMDTNFLEFLRFLYDWGFPTIAIKHIWNMTPSLGVQGHFSI